MVSTTNGRVRPGEGLRDSESSAIISSAGAVVLQKDLSVSSTIVNLFLNTVHLSFKRPACLDKVVTSFLMSLMFLSVADLNLSNLFSRVVASFQYWSSKSLLN